MKRFHVHRHVDDLDQNIGFYARLFAAEPTRVEIDSIGIAVKPSSPCC